MQLKTSLFVTSLVSLGVSLVAASLALAEPKVGDRVLALRAGTNSYFAGTVKKVPPPGEFENGTVTFDDGKTQEYGPITFEPSLRPFDWKIGSQIECAADAATAVDVGENDSPKLTAGRVTAIDDKTIELDSSGTKTKFPLAACRYRRTWWDELSPHWRNYASYKTVKALPKAGMKSPTHKEIESSFSFYLESADGGSYIVIKKCVAIGKKWGKIMQGGALVARTVDVACAIAIPLPPKPRENFTCLVDYGQCRQEWQGGNVYGGCEWNNSTRASEQIACKSVK